MVKIFVPSLIPALGKINTLFQEKFLGGIDRHLNGIVNISLAARFRTVPEEYEPLAFKVVKEILRSGFLAVDVGANIGLYTITMAKLVGASGKVVSFEPASESFYWLLDHIRRNNLCETVEAYMLVVGEKCGRSSFTEEGVLGTNRIGGSHSQGKGARTVERIVVTLDQFFCKNDSFPDFIKIDVEGYEMAVLEGAKKTLRKKRCPVLCELHPGFWRTMNLKPEDFVRLTTDLGYHIFELEGEPCSDFERDKRVLLR